jgi:hypothetical protein
MLNKPENQAKIAEIITSMNKAYTDFNAQHQSLFSVKNNQSTLSKAALAFEERAAAIRAELKEIMRETSGKPDRRLLAKQAELRVTIETAEDYTQLSTEAGEEMEKITLSISPLARNLVNLREKLYRTYYSLIFSEAIEEVAPKLKIAMSALCSPNITSKDERIQSYPYGGLADNEIAKQLLYIDEMKIIMNSPPSDLPYLPEEIRLALEKTELDGFIPISPAREVFIRNCAKKHSQANPQHPPIQEQEHDHAAL